MIGQERNRNLVTTTIEWRTDRPKENKFNCLIAQSEYIGMDVILKARYDSRTGRWVTNRWLFSCDEIAAWAQLPYVMDLLVALAADKEREFNGQGERE